MQRIYFHKTVCLDKPLKELISISVDESIQYKLEQNGMRAIGSIVIYGDYEDVEQRNKIKENIDLDIFASLDKIEDKRDFHVKVEDFDYSIQDGNLKLVIQTNVYGVKDAEDKHIHVKNEHSSEKEIKTMPHIEELLREEDEKSFVSKREDETIQTITKEQLENKDDLKKEDDDIGMYYFYVIQNGDSYHTISSRYKMDEKVIRDYNGNKEIKEGNIIIIPYLP